MRRALLSFTRAGSSFRSRARRGKGAPCCGSVSHSYAEKGSFKKRVGLKVLTDWRDDSIFCYQNELLYETYDISNGCEKSPLCQSWKRIIRKGYFNTVVKRVFISGNDSQFKAFQTTSNSRVLDYQIRQSSNFLALQSK